jgi:SAM-dependent methyltransferase
MTGGFDADRYAADLGAETGFEVDCIRARHNFNLRHLRRWRLGRVLEIGCGNDLLFDRATAEGISFDRWTVVEPAQAFADLCRERARLDRRLEVFQCLCEDLAASAAASPLAPFDVAIISSVLQFSPDPERLLRAALGFLRRGARVLVNTPNARSFHRLLAVEMGLIDNPYATDDSAARMQKTTTFDPRSLAELLTARGVTDLEFEGYMFKPFTHEQMARALPLLPPNATVGLEELGRRFPANAAEIAYAGVKA